MSRLRISEDILVPALLVLTGFDVFVDSEAIPYVTEYNAGLNILQYEG